MILWTLPFLLLLRLPIEYLVSNCIHLHTHTHVTFYTEALQHDINGKASHKQRTHSPLFLLQHVVNTCFFFFFLFCLLFLSLTLSSLLCRYPPFISLTFYVNRVAIVLSPFALVSPYSLRQMHVHFTLFFVLFSFVSFLSSVTTLSIECVVCTFTCPLAVAWDDAAVSSFRSLSSLVYTHTHPMQKRNQFSVSFKSNIK